MGASPPQTEQKPITIGESQRSNIMKIYRVWSVNQHPVSVSADAVTGKVTAVKNKFRPVRVNKEIDAMLWGDDQPTTKELLLEPAPFIKR